MFTAYLVMLNFSRYSQIDQINSQKHFILKIDSNKVWTCFYSKRNNIIDNWPLTCDIKSDLNI